MKYLSIILLVLFCGCKEKKDSQFWGLKAGDTIYIPFNRPSDTIYVRCDTVLHLHGYMNCYIDLSRIHDTIYRTKVTHINSAKSVIIGGDSNSPINQN